MQKMRQARPRPIPDDNDNYWKAVYELGPMGGRSWQAFDGRKNASYFFVWRVITNLQQMRHFCA